MSTVDKKIFVCRGNVVFFLNAVGDQVREDILCSNLAAQIRASKQYPEFADSDRWYREYRKALGVFGWSLQRQASREYEVGESSSLTIMEIVEKELLMYIPASNVESMVEALKKIDALPVESAPACVLRDNMISTNLVDDSEANEKSISRIRFSLVFCGPGSIAHALYLNLATLETLGPNVFSQVLRKGSLKGSVTVGYVSEELVDAHYASIREKIAAQLGDSRQALIKPVLERLLKVPEVAPFKGPGRASDPGV